MATGVHSSIVQWVSKVEVQVEQEGECAVVGESDVLVRQSDKDAHNDLVIEGAVGRLFYQVREEVYQHYRLIPSEK